MAAHERTRHRSRKNQPPSPSAPQHEADDISGNGLVPSNKFTKYTLDAYHSGKETYVRGCVVHSNVLHVHWDVVFVRQHVPHRLHPRVLRQHPLCHLVKCRLTAVTAVKSQPPCQEDKRNCHSSNRSASHRVATHLHACALVLCELLQRYLTRSRPNFSVLPRMSPIG